MFFEPRGNFSDFEINALLKEGGRRKILVENMEIT
jgi:hypothetical protein